MFDDSLPPGWCWTTLDALKASGRSVISGPFGSNISAKFFEPEGVPVIRGNNVTDDMTKFVDDGFVFVTPEKADELNCDAVENDLIFTAAGTIGQVGIIPRTARYKRYVISNKQLRARLDSSLVDPLYAFYWFSSPRMIEHIRQQNTGSTIPLINLSVLRSLPIPLPPSLVEQHAIAHILEMLDDKIELNRRMNETLEAIARAIFKSWFVDFDPVRAKASGEATESICRRLGLTPEMVALFPDRFQDSELDEIPEEWTVRSLSDCAEYINGLAFRNEHFSKDRAGLPIIKIGELKDGITEQTKFTKSTFDAKYRITSGDILFSWSGSPDTSIDTFVWVGTDGWLNQHIFKVAFKRTLEKYFVYYLLRHLKTEFVEIARNKQTTGLGHVTVQDLKRLNTVFPSDSALIGFNSVVEALFQKSYGNRSEANTLTALRDVLLPRLVSGELRVPARAA
jgi:type I restriction enzyme S subunit